MDAEGQFSSMLERSKIKEGAKGLIPHCALDPG